MKVQIHNLKNLNSQQQEKIISAMNKGCPLISMDIWEKRILGLKLTETRGMTNKQIVDLVRSGKDGNGTQADGDIDVDIEGFFKLSSTIGWTYLGATKTYINRRFLDRFSEAEVFGHVVHEALHRYGFAHRYRHSTSVPYQLGYASRNLFMEYYAGKPLMPEMFLTQPLEFTFEIVS